MTLDMHTQLSNGISNNLPESHDFEEVQIPVPWGHITGKWWGPRNVQPIIALHGWQDNCGTFDNLSPLLKDKGLSVYCIDLPGHGFSSPLPGGQNYYIFWDGIHFLRRIVQYFSWKDITIIGHSLGGAIAFLYAATYPEDIKKYVSIDIASPSVRNLKRMCDALGSTVDKFLSYEKNLIHKTPCYPYDDMVDIVFDAHKGSIDRHGCEILLRRGMKRATHKEGYIFTRDPRLKTALLGFMSIEQVLEFANRITCEVMNIRATDGLKLDHPEHYDLVLDKIGENAKKLERFVYNGTHHLHLNDAESIAPDVYNFLTS